MTTEQLKKVGKGALIAGAGAAFTYLAAWVSTADFGDMTPIVVAAFSVASNAFWQWYKSEGGGTEFKVIN